MSHKFPHGTFFVRCIQNGLYLDAKGAGTSKGTKAIVWMYNGDKNQQWQFDKEKRTIKCVHNNLVLDMKGGKGATIVVWTDENKDTQKWTWDGKHIISDVRGSDGKEQIIDVKGQSNKKGTDVIVWPPNGGLNQEWELLTLNGTPYNSEDEGGDGSSIDSSTESDDDNNDDDDDDEDNE